MPVGPIFSLASRRDWSLPVMMRKVKRLSCETPGGPPKLGGKLVSNATGPTGRAISTNLRGSGCETVCSPLGILFPVGDCGLS